MAPIAGTYELVKNENFVEYLTGLGTEVTEEIAKKINAAKGVLKVSVDGGKYTLSSESGSSPHVMTFASGEKFVDEVLKGFNMESVATVADSKITIVSSSGDGRSGERIYEFTDAGLTITYTSKGVSAVGKRTYKRV